MFDIIFRHAHNFFSSNILDLANSPMLAESFRPKRHPPSHPISRRNVNFEEKITIHRIWSRRHFTKTERRDCFMNPKDFSRIRREIRELLKREKKGTLPREDQEHLRGLEQYVGFDQEKSMMKAHLKKRAIRSVLSKQHLKTENGEWISNFYRRLSKTALLLARKRAILDQEANSYIVAPLTVIMSR